MSHEYQARVFDILRGFTPWMAAELDTLAADVALCRRDGLDVELRRRRGDGWEEVSLADALSEVGSSDEGDR